jgi:hypothetical protein
MLMRAPFNRWCIGPCRARFRLWRSPATCEGPERAVIQRPRKLSESECYAAGRVGQSTLRLRKLPRRLTMSVRLGASLVTTLPAVLRGQQCGAPNGSHVLLNPGLTGPVTATFTAGGTGRIAPFSSLHG